MDILLFRIFQRVAELGNLTKAAYELGTSPSLISKDISRIESLFGRSLFERKANRLFLNECGLAVLESSYKITSYEDNLYSDLLRLNQSSTSQISLAVHAGAALVPNIIKSFHDKYPLVQIQLAYLPFSQTAIRQSFCDLTLYHSYNETAEQNNVTLTMEPIMLAIGRSNKLSEKFWVLPEDTISVKHVYYSQNRDAQNNINEFISAAKLSGNIFPETVQQTAVIRKMISSGEYAAFVPKYDGTYSYDPNIVLIPIVSPLAFLRLQLSWRQSICVSPYMFDLKDIILNYFMQLRLNNDLHHVF